MLPEMTSDCGPVSLTWQDGPLWKRQCEVWVVEGDLRSGDGSLLILLLGHFGISPHSRQFLQAPLRSEAGLEIRFTQMESWCV